MRYPPRRPARRRWSREDSSWPLAYAPVPQRAPADRLVARPGDMCSGFRRAAPEPQGATTENTWPVFEGGATPGIGMPREEGVVQNHQDGPLGERSEDFAERAPERLARLQQRRSCPPRLDFESSRRPQI